MYNERYELYGKAIKENISFTKPIRGNWVEVMRYDENRYEKYIAAESCPIRRVILYKKLKRIREFKARLRNSEPFLYY